MRNYEIHKGQHSIFGARFRPVLNTGFQSAFCRFDESCRYDIGYYQRNWNKLIGKTTHGFNPHGNSMRIAWRVVDELDKIELGLYTYRNGIRQVGEGFAPIAFCRVDFGEQFHVHLIHADEVYSATVTRNNGKVYSIQLQARKAFRIPFPCVRLNPYFGGNIEAPHDMIISINHIKQ